jgi:hypothetical protein
MFRVVRVKKKERRGGEGRRGELERREGKRGTDGKGRGDHIPQPLG